MDAMNDESTGTGTTIDPLIYKALVDQAKDYAVFVLSPDGRIMTWNLGAQRIKGYAPDEIVGRHFSIFYTREAVDSGWPAHELKVAEREGRFEDEGWRCRKDGTHFWASVVITALRDERGKLLGFSKITRDLTDRKMNEEALRQSEARFRLLIEGVVDYAIFMLDTEGIVTSWNAGAERIQGYGREDIIGRHISTFYTAEDIAADKPWEEISLARRTGRSEIEGWRTRKNGERFWARDILSAVHDGEGCLRGFAKITQDLTERRHLEELEQAAGNLHEFIAILAHELRNPLAPIRAAVQTMAGLSRNEPALAALCQIIDRQSAQLARIADDMIDVSRISRGVLGIEHVPVDVAEVVRRAVETSAPAIETSRHALSVDLPAVPLLVKGDIHRLTQLLANILNNAARYTPAGGRIAIVAADEGDNVVVRVRDNGCGIDARMMERIFGMFVQGRGTLQRMGGGMGIGLALARKLAELHGGSLDGRSEGLGKGSEFRVRLPRLNVAQALPQVSVKSTPPPPALPEALRRILIVDDNADAALAMELLLKSSGHETCVAHDGRSAIELAAAFGPDVVLLDIGMPGMDGYEVARRLRQIERDPPMLIVAVTGWGKEADRLKSREAGFDLHLVKPVDPHELAQALGGRGAETLH
jgi:PAS domain S-box-containing protein